MLLLGFGDVRNALATAAACTAAQPASKCRELRLHLNNVGTLNVARGLLMLHLVRVCPLASQPARQHFHASTTADCTAKIAFVWRSRGAPSILPPAAMRPLLQNALQADTVDPSQPDDLEFFWGVHYCLKLPAPHAERLAAAVRGLLAQPDRLAQQLGSAAEATRFQGVLRGWLEAQPSVEAVREERRRLQMARLLLKQGRQVSTAAEVDEMHGGYAAAILSGLLPWPPLDGGNTAAVSNKVRLLHA